MRSSKSVNSDDKVNCGYAPYNMLPVLEPHFAKSAGAIVYIYSVMSSLESSEQWLMTVGETPSKKTYEIS